jgi:hypothetical protein
MYREGAQGDPPSQVGHGSSENRLNEALWLAPLYAGFWDSRSDAN